MWRESKRLMSDVVDRYSYFIPPQPTVHDTILDEDSGMKCKLSQPNGLHRVSGDNESIGEESDQYKQYLDTRDERVSFLEHLTLSEHPESESVYQ